MKTFLHCLLYLVVFWNVENFFEDKPYFSRKCDAIAKTLYLIADKEGRMPDIVALAEVENREVLLKLLRRTSLGKEGYGIVHYDSPDRRGIDCALLYRKETLQKKGSAAFHITDSLGCVLPTRDILLFESDSLAVLVNHHPSKVGENSEQKRQLAMRTMLHLCDSLQSCGLRVLSVGDFNDTLWGDNEKGTIKYNGKWQKIDGYFARGLKVREEVFDSPYLTQKDASFGGTKPKRSFSGPRYLGGVSDHYPIILEINQAAIP